MSLEFATRLIEILLGFALILQSLEHLLGRDPMRWCSILRLVLCGFLFVGFSLPVTVTTLFFIHVIFIFAYQGPYNGGSDRMILLILLCLSVAEWASAQVVKEFAISYLALQVVLSYFSAGLVKLRRSEWRSGRALKEILTKSVYLFSQRWRNLAAHPRQTKFLAWSLLAFELLFPLSLLNSKAVVIALLVAFVLF